MTLKCTDENVYTYRPSQLTEIHKLQFDSTKVSKLIEYEYQIQFGKQYDIINSIQAICRINLSLSLKILRQQIFPQLYASKSSYKCLRLRNSALYLLLVVVFQFTQAWNVSLMEK